MVSINSSVWVVCAILIAHVSAREYQIFATSLQSSKAIPIGSISYEKSAKLGFFTPEDSVIEGGEYCIGTKDLVNHECFSYIEVSDGAGLLSGKSLELQLNSDEEVEQIALVEKGQQQIIISSAAKQPIPNLNPVHATKQANQGPAKVTKKVTVKETVVDEEGNEVEVEREKVVEEEEDTRSFIQKYWMYIVPAVLLLASSMTPEEDKQ